MNSIKSLLIPFCLLAGSCFAMDQATIPPVAVAAMETNISSFATQFQVLDGVEGFSLVGSSRVYQWI